MTAGVNLFDPKAHPLRMTGLQHHDGFLPHQWTLYGKFTFSIIITIITIFEHMLCVCVCVHHKSLWFPLCNITSYLLYCSAHYSLGSDKAAQPVSPAAANHPRVTLASASAHLGYTHCINCSTDLVNCLSAADVRKRRGESDRERERMGMISSEKRRKTASIAHCSQTPLPPLVSASFSLWTNKFAFTLGCVCFHLPNEKETFLHISLPRGFSSSTENTHSETHTAYKYDYNSSHCSNNLKCGHLTT